MPDGSNRDRLRPLVDPIEKDIVAEYEASQIGLYLIAKRPPNSRKFGESLNAVEKIVDCAMSGRPLLRSEVEDFRNPLQGEFRPDDLIGQLLVPCQKAGSRLFMRHDSAGFDIGKPPVEISEKLHLIEERTIAFDIHQNRGALPFLRHNDGTAGAAHPINEALGSSAEIRGGHVFMDITGLSCHGPTILPRSPPPQPADHLRVHPDPLRQPGVQTVLANRLQIIDGRSHNAPTDVFAQEESR